MDPDKIRIEFQIENFRTKGELNAYFCGKSYGDRVRPGDHAWKVRDRHIFSLSPAAFPGLFGPIFFLILSGLGMVIQSKSFYKWDRRGPHRHI